MACSSTTAAASASAVNLSISTVHPDILETHILTRLDGPTLASTACVSSQLHSLINSEENLWTNICHSTWPSTTAPRLRNIISTFPGGPRSFFSDSFTNPDPDPATTKAVAKPSLNPDSSTELISAVDIYYRNDHLFSKVVETETLTGWFRCSPFRVDLLNPKDTIPTRIHHPDTEYTCRKLAEDFEVSWILIDPIGRRAMNVSSYKPVSVRRHWLTGEVHVRFASVLAGGDRERSSEFVQLGIVVTCGRSDSGEMHVREVSLQVEDMNGMHMNGKDSLVILQRALGGKRENRIKVEMEGKKRYEEYLEMKRKMEERKMRRERRLDMFCVAFGALIFTYLGLFFLIR